MSKMREAFEKWAKTNGYPTHLGDDGLYSDVDTYHAHRGYQAAIAAVKEGGAQVWVASDGESCSFTEPSKNYLRMAWWKPLYKLPENKA